MVTPDTVLHCGHFSSLQNRILTFKELILNGKFHNCVLPNYISFHANCTSDTASNFVLYASHLLCHGTLEL